MVAAGYPNHAGRGGHIPGITSGNREILRVKIEESGDGDWISEQLEAVRRGTAAILAHMPSCDAIEALMYSTRYATFSDEVTTPFAGVAALIYALIVGPLVSSIMGNLRELGTPVEQKTQ